MALQADDYADLAINTLADLGEGKFTDNITKYQDTVALKKVISQEQVKKQAGKSVDFNIMTDHNNSAEFVGLAYTVNPGIKSVLDKGTVPWRRMRYDYAWEYDLLAMNRSPRQIVNFMQTQRIAGHASGIVKLEQFLWRAPTLADDLSPYGLPYWIVKSSTAFTSGPTGNYGFNGLTPQDHTTVAGIDPDIETRWRNYAEPYTAVTQDDVVKKMRRAMHYTNFKPIVNEVPEYAGRESREVYTNWTTLEPLEVLLKAQNDDLGNDLDPTGGKAMIRRAKLQAVRELDDDTTNPIYGIDWSTIDIIALQDRWMHEDRFAKKPDQPSVGFVNVHCTFNTVCYDRRKNWVLSNGTTELSW